MNYFDFLTRVIDKGIDAAKRDYAKPHQRTKLLGAINGFHACRNKNVKELKSLLSDANEKVKKAREEGSTHYWYYVTFRSEIDWVCNCVSVILMTQDLPTIIDPSIRAFFTVREVIKNPNDIVDIHSQACS